MFLQNDGRPRVGIASLADCREQLHGELRTQRNLDHEAWLRFVDDV